jgi:hypothetical protein
MTCVSPRLVAGLPKFVTEGLFLAMLIGSPSWDVSLLAADQAHQRHADQQIQFQQNWVTRSRPAAAPKPNAVEGHQPASALSATATTPLKQPAPSLVRQAAEGRLIDVAPPAKSPPHVGSTGGVAQASFACDCEHCRENPHSIVDPSCGQEPAHGLFGRNLESPHEFDEPRGFEAACGLEGAGCGDIACDGSCQHSMNCGSRGFRAHWQRYELFAGVNGFTGPLNHPAATGVRGGSGSFGFYEGFNRGDSLGHLLNVDLASQFGIRATQSSLSGTEFTDDSRQQIFVTGGLFRRVDFGLQYGVVVDYLYDDWWYRNNLAQLRGELSWNDNCGHELGYQIMAGIRDESSTIHLIEDDGGDFQGVGQFTVTDQHRLFFRGRLKDGSSYEAFAGATNEGDGLLGGTVTSAFRGLVAVQAGATYLVPSSPTRAEAFTEEAWNLSLGIVFRPGGRTGVGRYSRPMFEVADNGTFMTKIP